MKDRKRRETILVVSGLGWVVRHSRHLIERKKRNVLGAEPEIHLPTIF